MTPSIQQRAKVGVLWNGVTSAVAQVASFALGVLLARLLLPEHFGMVASVLIFTEIAHSLTTSGIVTALIQRKEIHDRHYSTALTIQIALAIPVYIILGTLSPWVGLFLGSALLGQLLAVMSLSVLILPFVSIPTAILRKRLDFRSLGIAEIVQQLTSGTISVLLAYLGWGVWSLVYGRLISHAIKALHLSCVVRSVPRFHWSRQAAKDLFSFTTKVVAVNILNDVASNIDYLIVGRLLGPAQLGFYYRAYYLMTLPVSRITEAVNTVCFSAFAELQESDSTLKSALLNAVYYVSLLTLPLLVCLFWVAPAFVLTLYGEKWMASVVPLRIMCLAGILFSIEPILVSAITAKGYIGLEVKRQLLYVSVLLVGVFLGSYWGIIGVSAAVLVTSTIIYVVLQRLVKRLIQIPWSEFAEVLWPAVLAGAVMSLGLFSYQEAAHTFLKLHSPAMLVSSVIVGFTCYGTSLFLIARWTDNHITRQMVEQLRSYGQLAYRLLH